MLGCLNEVQLFQPDPLNQWLTFSGRLVCKGTKKVLFYDAPSAQLALAAVTAVSISQVCLYRFWTRLSLSQCQAHPRCSATVSENFSKVPCYAETILSKYSVSLACQ